MPSTIVLCLTILALQEPSDWDRFEVVELTSGLDRPLELAVAPDGRVFFIELSGRLAFWRPGTLEVVEAGSLDVFADQENGLLGLALDPGFAENHWLYLLHSPRDFSGQHLSRFTLDGERIDPASERLILAFEEQRQECCHHAGSLAFGPGGCLFVATGDNTNPGGDSEGYAPIDERDGRMPWDSLRGAANTDSLTGKILRILPTPDGGYEIPPGNLFPPDGSQGRPEIYCMGCRNPWRISVDRDTGFLYWGEVGPDAGGDGPRGPRGYDEINQARGPGNFGWPLFIADNRPYRAYDFATGELGAPFDPLRPSNDSRYNTGARVLPPAQPAWIYYPYADSPEFPELDAPGGRTACAGPVYHFDSELDSPTKFPSRYDGCLFVYEWSRNWTKVVRMDPAGDVEHIERFLPDAGWRRPVDMQFGPEGALYLLEYGSTWGTNADSRLVRIDYHAGNRAPVPRIAARNAVGPAPLAVELSSAGSFDRDAGDVIETHWFVHRSGRTGAGELVSREPEARVRFEEEGVYSVELELRDAAGAVARASLPVLVGNSPPQLAFDRPRPGGFFDPERPLEFHLQLTDAEDDADDSPGALEAIFRRACVEARWIAGPPPGATDPSSRGDPPGLARMKASDCFNCHAVEHRIVGPSLLEIAERYRDPAGAPVAGAVETAVARVRDGSSGVWGSAVMLPHPQHGEEELRTMVAWVLSLESGAPSTQLVPGLSGELSPPGISGAGTWLLEATYTDGGGGPVGPLTARARLYLRSHTVEAEHFSSRSGTQTLDSTSASGGRFIGAIDHGNWLRFEGVDLAGISRVTCRVSSAGSGGTVELRADDPGGELLGSLTVEPNGAWEDWFEIEAPLHDPGGLHDLLVLFLDPAAPNALMNLDSLRFE